MGFIGAGKVGVSLGKYLVEHNIKVIGYYSRNFNSAQEGANFTNTIAFKTIEEIVKNSDAIFITTEDSQIKNVWNIIREMPINNKLICHCSGSLSSEVFSDIRKYGAYGYSIHPMFAINDKYNSYKDLPNAFITIEGHKEYQGKLEQLFLSLGNKVQIISKENKSLYHAAAVTVSNFILGLVNNSLTYLKDCGFSEELAMEALYPLIEFNLKNIKENGIMKSLTGPVERGDLETITSHCKVLNQQDKKMYKLLSENILSIAEMKNKQRNYEKIREYLKR
ncbi:MAG: Rossmann-like and DUF2520 domain-containing protein [Clostridium sp.]